MNTPLNKKQIIEYCKFTKRLKVEELDNAICVEYDDIWVKIELPKNEYSIFNISSEHVKFTAYINFFDDVLDNLIMCSSRERKYYEV